MPDIDVHNDTTEDFDGQAVIRMKFHVGNYMLSISAANMAFFLPISVSVQNSNWTDITINIYTATIVCT